MISEYLGEVKYENPWKDLKPWQKTPYEKAHGKHIYKNQSGHYQIQKTIKNKHVNFGTYNTFQEAIEARDELIRNGWVKIPTVKEEQRKYFMNINISNRHFNVSHKGKFYGCTATLEEALYYRDILRDNDWSMMKPYELDLQTNNPYLDGFDYPVPERLILPPKEEKKVGIIVQGGREFYTVHKGKDYYGGYRTYEMAYYVREKLRECNWDKEQLEQIVDDYPVWYTWLMNFYKFIIPKGNGWVVNITGNHSESGKLEHIYCRRLEDALWERDLLLKYDWDEELLIECADDDENPYYDMTLPPYPQRKIRRIHEREDRTELFNQLFDLIQSDDSLSMEDYARACGTNSVTLRNIFRKEFDITWETFKKTCTGGENPNDLFEQKPVIYKPNLEKTPRKNYGNYVSYYKNLKSPYLIYHKNRDDVSGYFGAYPTRELANKISNDLQACNWDKSKLKEIQAKHGWTSKVNSKRWVYPQYYTSKKTGEKYVTSYQVRKKDKGSKLHINYGMYKDKRVAELVRDLLIVYDWNKDYLDKIKSFAYYCVKLIDNDWRCNL